MVRDGGGHVRGVEFGSYRITFAGCNAQCYWPPSAAAAADSREALAYLARSSGSPVTSLNTLRMSSVVVSNSVVAS